MHFLKLVTDGQMSNRIYSQPIAILIYLNEDTKNHGILGGIAPANQGEKNKQIRCKKDKHYLSL